jgi:adenylate kinase family enzyme
MTSLPPPEAPMRRVMIVGCPGAGKSTYARRLAEKLALPLVHLDFHYWRSGWTDPSPADWRVQAMTLAAAPEWIMEGNFHSTFDIRMPRADSQLWLDYSRRICLCRVLVRLAKDYGRSRPDLPEGCPEKFDLEFLRFVWNYPAKHRPHIPDGIARYGSHLRVTRFLRDRDADAFLALLGAR